MRLFTVIVLTAFSLNAAAIIHPNDPGRTHLGPAGNKAIAERYQAYLKNGLRCQSLGDGKRILITGFGLFSGIVSNISGALVKGFANEQLLPSNLNTASFPHTEGVLPKGIVLSDTGVDSFQRWLTIDQQKYNVCVLVLDVQWDFAAAVIVTEMQAFAPESIYMFGQGSNSVIIESGAQNKTLTAHGFTNQGDLDPANLPIEQVMYPGLPQTVALSVDQNLVAQSVSEAVSELGYKLELPPQHRPSNDYICNNVTYTAQSAANGEEIALAGGEVVLHPKWQNPPIISFIHLPVENSLQIPAQGWMKFITKVLTSGS